MRGRTSSNSTAIACAPGSIRGEVHLLTRTGRDWTGKYPVIATAVRTLPVRQAYLDGELCGVRLDCITSFALIQNAAE